MFFPFGKTYQITNTLEDLALGLWEQILFHSTWSHLGFSNLHILSHNWYVKWIKQLTKKYKNSYDNRWNLALNRFSVFKWLLDFDYLYTPSLYVMYNQLKKMYNQL